MSAEGKSPTVTSLCSIQEKIKMKQSFSLFSLVPALILTACGVSRLLMLSISSPFSSSVRSRPSRIDGSLKTKFYLTLKHVLLKWLPRDSTPHLWLYMTGITYDTACLKASYAPYPGRLYFLSKTHAVRSYKCSSCSSLLYFRTSATCLRML